MRYLFTRIALAALILCVSASASALTAVRFSPEGMMARIARVQADFDAPAVALGNDGAADPFLVTCDADAIKGAGRWTDPQHWVYVFDKPLAGAVSCQAQPNPDFRDVQGQPLAGDVRRFATGGPRARLVMPWNRTISEDQIFVLRFNAAPDTKSLLEHAYCEVEGLGEAVPTRLVTGVDRAQILKTVTGSDAADAWDDARLLQCKRLLPPEARVRLVVAAGVRAPGQAGQPGVPSRVGLAEDFQVRTAFNAVMSCTRTNAQAPCSPLFPILVAFSRPVPRDLATRVALNSPQGPRVARQFGPDAEEASGDAVETLQFDPPFEERSTLTLTLPDALRDDMGSPLANADRFPLKIPMDAMPPLAKFASGEFGIVERFAEGAPGQDRPALAPLALRRVESPLQTRDLLLSAGQASDQVITDDVQALQWYARVKNLQEGSLTAGQFADRLALRTPREAREGERTVDVRSRSLFGPKDPVRKLTLPGVKDAEGQDIEMVGIPLAEPGLHVLEVASPRLGAALLKREGAAADEEIMHVRSAVLVTNLAVHLKTGRDDTLVWVTTLDRGQPVAGARVAVLSCDGRRLLDGETDAQGVWHAATPVTTDDYCEGTQQSGVFVTARIPADHPQAHGQADFSFAWSNWDRGIEPWRFNVPASRSRDPDLVAHAVLDRTLLRVGETVSMKLFLRRLSRNGVENLPADRLPAQVRLSHEGSGDTETLALKWQTQPGGGQYALLDYMIPRKAHLGSYSIELQPAAGADDDWTPWLHAGDFRVESFKLPLLTGSLKVAGDEAQAGGPLVAPQSVHADLQLSWISGGPARDLPATLSAVARPLTPSFPEYDDFSFGVQGSGDDDAQSGDPESAGAAPAGLRRLILDRHALRLDGQGGARVDLADLLRPSEPQSWLFEASFADPSGEVQTLAQTARVWPAAVVVGLRTGRWMSRGEKSSVTLLALDTAGRPQAGVPVQLDGRVRTTYSTRKRLVGGFYAYDSHEQVAPLGTLCQGQTDAKGRLECPVSLDRDGQIELFAQARDAQSRVSRASTSIWVWGDEAWFGEGNDDRIDVIPAKADYKPGETAEFTVRMPFRQARALVAVEREGVLETHVVDLDGDEPVVRLPVQAGWGPNVYVSVLAVRGRVRQVPWTSFFEWGWRHPLDWMDARAARSDTVPEPTGLVDLAKPAFRFGLAGIRVQSEADRLQVKVEADHSSYQVRQHARVRIQAMLPDGKPAAGAGVAFAAVDEALLELRDNDSWDLLRAMRVERDYGVETATGQGEVVGRRHYGRKAVAAGGGGGFNATRELFDTRLLWRGDLTLDAQGQATVDVPLNDSLTRFRLVAVVDQGQGMFGTGFTDIVSTQDLQVVSGLPQVAREGDRYEARATVRNRTERPMTLALSAGVAAAGGAEQTLPEQALRLEPGAAQTVAWPVTAPLLSGRSETEALKWRFEARTTEGEAASDRIMVGQTLLPAVPVTVRQATLLQILDGVPQQVPVDASARALLDAAGVPRGGVRVSLQSSLAGSLPGVSDWLSAYPYTCVEQLSAKALGRRDPAAWQALMKRLPDYQTESGLLSYFPGGRGSVVLTAHLLEIATRAQAPGNAYGLPGVARERMLAALQDYVFGRLTEDGWAPVRDDFWRKLIAVDALALAGAWQPGMLDSFALEVSDWPTAAVVTWLSILRHVPDLADREALSTQAEAVLRARLARHGTTLVLADDTVDSGWWLMSNPATAQARLLMTVLDRPDWRADLPRLMTGLLSMQRDGAWSTTTANVLGTLAVDQFARKVETHAGEGAVRVALPPGAPAVLPWADMPQADGIRRQSLELPWPQARTGTLDIAQQGRGSGWATIAARAAVPVAKAVDAGLQVERTVVPVFKAQADRWSAGDVYRVRLRVRTQESLVWSVVSDPVPAGASILGGGLGRDSSLATAGEAQNDWNQPSFVERDAGVFRAYYEVMEPGERTLEYTVRLNVPGDYQLPPTRAEALYQPDVFGETPNTPLHVEPQP